MNGWVDGCKREKDVKRSERHRLAELQHRSFLFLSGKLHPKTHFTDNDSLRISEYFTYSLVYVQKPHLTDLSLSARHNYKESRDFQFEVDWEGN